PSPLAPPRRDPPPPPSPSNPERIFGFKEFFLSAVAAFAAVAAADIPSPAIAPPPPPPGVEPSAAVGAAAFLRAELRPAPEAAGNTVAVVFDEAVVAPKLGELYDDPYAVAPGHPGEFGEELQIQVGFVALAAFEQSTPLIQSGFVELPFAAVVAVQAALGSVVLFWQEAPSADPAITP